MTKHLKEASNDLLAQIACGHPTRLYNIANPKKVLKKAITKLIDVTTEENVYLYKNKYYIINENIHPYLAYLEKIQVINDPSYIRYIYCSIFTIDMLKKTKVAPRRIKQMFLMKETYPVKIEVITNGKMQYQYIHNEIKQKENNLHQESKARLILQDFFDEKTIKKILYNQGVISPTSIILKKDYTFGIEIETATASTNNMITEAKTLNLKDMPDGSISGREYVTGILKGDYGVLQLKKICTMLQRKAIKIDNKCGIHVHVGNVKLNKIQILALMILGKMVETEVFKMLPESRRKNGYCKAIDISYFEKAIKDGDYTEAYRLFGSRIGNGNISSKYKKGSYHVNGRYASERYTWLNLLTYLFTRKEHGATTSSSASNINDIDYTDATIEFRPHSATTSYKKIKEWIKICFAIVNYAENNAYKVIEIFKKGQTISLLDVIDYTYINKQGENLKKYIEERQKYINLYTEKHEYENDINFDKKMTKITNEIKQEKNA